MHKFAAAASKSCTGLLRKIATRSLALAMEGISALSVLFSSDVSSSSSSCAVKQLIAGALLLLLDAFRELFPAAAAPYNLIKIRLPRYYDSYLCKSAIMPPFP